MQNAWRTLHGFRELHRLDSEPWIDLGTGKALVAQCVDALRDRKCKTPLRKTHGV